MEDGREIFDDDLDDDVVEKKGQHSHSIMCSDLLILSKHFGKCEWPFFGGLFLKPGAQGTDSKKISKKTTVAKPNTIKSLFMNSNVKRPAEVRALRRYWIAFRVASITNAMIVFFV